MKNRKMLKGMLILVLLLLFAASAYAEVATSYGSDFRLRQETWDNLFDMNASDVKSTGTAPYSTPDINFWRLKTTPWLKVDMDNQYTFFARLCNEARYYMGTDGAAFRKEGLNKDEVVIDNLYVSAKKLGGLPLDLTIGRQDFVNVFGEGFLIMDGTPGDGSRTYYFNAARATVKFNDRYNLDMAYVFTQKWDGALPSLYSHDDYNHPLSAKRQLNTSGENGVIVYGRGKVTDSLNVEPYYIFKREDTDPAALDINTFGVRALCSFGDGWRTRGEYAHQFGKYDNGVHRIGDGGYFYFGRLFADVAMKPSFDLGYIYLSGDDLKTKKNEGWDPLFSRYPWMSELYNLSYAKEENGIAAYWTDLSMIRAMSHFALTADTGLDLNYNYLLAPENDSTAPIFSTSGNKRGDLIQVKLSHTFSKQLAGYVLFEDFVPGDFYKSTNRDNVTFVRWELLWKI